MSSNLIKLLPGVFDRALYEQFDNDGVSTVSGGGNFSSKAFMLSQILKEKNEVKNVFWTVSNSQEKEQIVRFLKLWGDRDVFDLDLDDSPIQTDEVKRNNKIAITYFLSQITIKKKGVFVVEYKDLFDLYHSKSDLKESVVEVSAGDEIDSVEFFNKLIEIGYEVSEDKMVQKGEYYKLGDVFFIYPVNSDYPIKIEFDFDKIERISCYDMDEKSTKNDYDKYFFYPLGTVESKETLFSYFGKGDLVLEDELDMTDDEMEQYEEVLKSINPQCFKINFTSFMEDSPYHHHLHYLSVLKYQNILDFILDSKEKFATDWKIILFTKHKDEYKNVFEDKDLKFNDANDGILDYKVNFVHVKKDGVFPLAFQNPQIKLLVVTDREVIDLKEGKKADDVRHRVFSDFLTGLKINDYVVHTDHGIGVFRGLAKRTVDNVTREYLEIGYAENDKLFVPIDQADKVSKYIGAGDQPPRLTRLGSAEWSTITSKVRQETEKIAKELLNLYARRDQAKGFKYKDDSDVQNKFEKTFPYEETPGQMRAIKDVKNDMENDKPMDRLVCGDVGFGKTEVAMRAAFKAVQSGKQVAFVAPITILADQHYKSFKKRMDSFHVRVEMMSRFKSAADQRRILEKLKKGEVDIVIGTHRLLQPDVAFKNLGLVIIDEEQRFGVKQKEKLKDLRTEVDILTLTATPIPRTLNISLHGLRDITTITTPPPGRLPIITEVRRFSYNIIREVIMREIERGGQVYFLHNRVQTIEDVAAKLRSLVPEARFVVTHGKLSSTDLEERIMAFKNGEFNVLVSSTIIENGIDLSNANTLIVNDADRFGLAQLYQLRGRVGRGRTQAYAYFLYKQQRLHLDAKKRLRAIVEASELGSGFQIAMKDLEIRGAGDILGASQHGSINVVGVSHFIRMLNQAVAELKAGVDVKDGEKPIEVSIELPLPALIPDDYIVNFKEKINFYQKLAGADNYKYLSELRADLVEDYGKMPTEVSNLFRLLELKLLAKKAHITNVKAENVHSNDERQVVLTMSDKVKPENIMNLLEYNNKWIISGTKLKCKFQDLGVHWVDELGECLRKVGGKVKRTGLRQLED